MLLEVLENYVFVQKIRADSHILFNAEMRVPQDGGPSLDGVMPAVGRSGVRSVISDVEFRMPMVITFSPFL